MNLHQINGLAFCRNFEGIFTDRMQKKITKLKQNISLTKIPQTNKFSKYVLTLCIPLR